MTVRPNEMSAPHIKSRETNRTVMGDVIIAMLPLYFMAYYFYGMRALFLGAVSMATCGLCDALCSYIVHRSVNLRDYSSLVTGMMLPLLLPATVPYYVVIVGGVFAIAVIKYPFGGTGQNLFNPAAAAFSLIVVSWPGLAFSYPVPLARASALMDGSAQLVEGAARVLKMGGVPSIGTLDMITGNFAGPMGATNILVLTTCLIYLIFRRTVAWQLPVSFLGTTAFIAFFFPRIPTSGGQSVLFELLSGTLMFGAVFMLTDPVTSPKRRSAKVVYGIISAVVTMLFRYYGGYEQTMMFTILLMNAFAPMIDRCCEWIFRIVRRAGHDAKSARQRAAKKAKEQMAQV